MAETGVVDSPAGESKSPAKGGDSLKKNKKLLVGGGLVAGLFLVMSHKGSGASSGTTGGALTQAQDQLQQQSDMVAAEESALQSGFTGGGTGGGFDSGLGAGSSSDGTSGTDATQGDNSTTANPAAAPAATAAAGGNSGPNVTINVAPSGPPVPPGKGKGKKQKNNSKNKVANPHHTSSHGHGTTVHGRTFPGGTSHTIHPPKKQPNGDVHTRVTVNHGGHTTHHVSVNGGKSWIDNPRGSGPPGRGTTHEFPGGDTDRGFSKPVTKPIASHRVPAVPAKRPAPVPHETHKPPPHSQAPKRPAHPVQVRR